MKLNPRHRKRQRRGSAPRIAISQEEITADLNYRGERAAGAVRGARSEARR